MALVSCNAMTCLNGHDTGLREHDTKSLTRSVDAIQQLIYECFLQRDECLLFLLVHWQVMILALDVVEDAVKRFGSK